MKEQLPIKETDRILSEARAIAAKSATAEVEMDLLICRVKQGIAEANQLLVDVRKEKDKAQGIKPLPEAWSADGLCPIKIDAPNEEHRTENLTLFMVEWLAGYGNVKPEIISLDTLKNEWVLNDYMGHDWETILTELVCGETHDCKVMAEHIRFTKIKNAQ